MIDAAFDDVLHRHGIETVFAAPLPEHVARLLADADAALRFGVGASVVDDAGLRLAGRPGAQATREYALGDPDDYEAVMAAACAEALTGSAGAVIVRRGSTAAHGAPGPAGATLSASDVERISDAANPVVLAGPAVVRAGFTEGLRSVAHNAQVGVLNTWGAKGIFDWQNPHHLATAGLQERDFELARLAAADLIVATGVDPDEARPELWQLAPSVVVDPSDLVELGRSWVRTHRAIDPVPLRTELGALVRGWWDSDALSMPPARVTRTYAEVLAGDGLIAADPGTAGFWIARTFATTKLGSVLVPALADTRGFSVAVAIASRLVDPGRRVLAVVDEPVDAAVAAMLEAAEELGVAVPLEVWGPAGDVRGPRDHEQALRAALAAADTTVTRPAVDLSHTDALIDLAGDIVAWRN